MHRSNTFQSRFVQQVLLSTLMIAGGLPCAAVTADESIDELKKAYQAMAVQAASFREQIQQLDVDNRNLTTQLARQRQATRFLRQQLESARQRLAAAANQRRAAEQTRTQLEKRLTALQSATHRTGGAVLTANNSVQRNLQVAVIPGLTVRQHKDLIRIVLPADQLFRPKTTQLLPSSATILDLAAGAVARHYPRQLVGIEAYADNAPLPPGGIIQSSHQLTAGQALTVFYQLVSRNRLPDRQLFILAQGSNQPIASNATEAGRAANRRIEIVIYPDTMDGN